MVKSSIECHPFMANFTSVILMHFDASTFIDHLETLAKICPKHHICLQEIIGSFQQCLNLLAIKIHNNQL